MSKWTSATAAVVVALFLSSVWEHGIRVHNDERAKICAAQPQLCRSTVAWTGPVKMIDSAREFLKPVWAWVGEWAARISDFISYLRHILEAGADVLLALFHLLISPIVESVAGYVTWAWKNSSLPIVLLGSIVLVGTVLFFICRFTRRGNDIYRRLVDGMFAEDNRKQKRNHSFNFSK